MSAALPAHGRHLRVVDEAVSQHRDQSRPPGTGTPIVGYIVLVPEGTDPTELFTADGTRAEFRPLTPADEPAAPARTTQPSPQPAGAAPAAPHEPSQGLHIDPERHTAEADGRPLDLTYLEFELLAHLVAHPQRVHTRDHLVATLWGYSHIGDGRTVDVHIARLRRKLGPDYRDRVVTVRRVGYKYEPGAGR